MTKYTLNKFKAQPRIEHTREEEYIAHYLNENGISYISQHQTKKLKNDQKSHRRVDFYLNKFNIYIEYMGMYNESKLDRERYEEKRKIYFQNNMPTLLLKPHDLGILDYAFHTKTLKILRHPKFFKKSKLIRYKLNRFINKKGLGSFFLTILFLYLFTVMIFYPTGFDEGIVILLQIATLATLIYHLIKFISSFIKYIVKDF
jgi:hypothetical protein